MMIVGDLVHLTRGPRENGHRPAVDPLFRSAARSHGQRVIGVILSGAMDDGTAGLRTVKERGGVAVVQDPEDALHPSMPMNAIEYVDPDHVVPVAQLAALLCGLLDESLPAEPAPPVASAPQPPATAAGGYPPDTAGPATGLTCPECGGALWERDEEGMVRFACRLGHAFAPDSLADEQARALEAALWGAMRSLEERADLLRRISRRRGAGESTSRRFEERARSAERHVSELRATLSGLSPVTVPDADALAQRERRDESGP
jgi:two-component system chemotaxis response regulator CheB